MPARIHPARAAMLLLLVIASAALAQPSAESRTMGRLLERKAQQERDVGSHQAFHGFQFTNSLSDSQIRFRSRAVDDVGKYNKPVHYDHGFGMAVADVDGDNLLDLYFVSQLGGNQLWKNLGKGKFADITATAGVALNGRINVAASFADIDNDGDADLFVTSVRTGNALFENLGAGRFREITREAGVEYRGHSSGATFFDYNRDGLLDLFVCNIGKFTTEQQGAGGYYVAISNAFHGHLEPQRSEASRLYQNLGARRFRDVTGSVLAHSAWTGDAAFCDVTEDGYPDLYVLSMQGDDRFYVNDQGNRFVESTAKYFPKTPWGAMGIKFFDYNNDGRLDLLVTDMHSDMTTKQISLQQNLEAKTEKTKSEAFCTVEWTDAYLQGASNNIFGNALFQNRGTLPWVEVSDTTGVETFWPWGVTVADLNADGYQDLFLPSGMGYPYYYGINTFLINDFGRNFFNAEFAVGLEPRPPGKLATEYFVLNCSGSDRNHPECQGQRGRVAIHGSASSRSSAVFDLDGDGDLDLITHEMVDPPQVFLSNLSDKRPLHYLSVQLEGTKSNRDGLGAVVKVIAGDLQQVQQADGKSGYLAQSRLPLFFGLGTHTQVDRVEVKWPSGKTQVLAQAIPINRLLRITEPAD